MFDKDVPGPAKYDLLTINGFGKDGIKYSINPEGNKKRYKSGNKNYIEPGPGHYEITDNFNENIINSNLKNTANILWSTSKIERFKDPSNLKFKIIIIIISFYK